MNGVAGKLFLALVGVNGEGGRSREFMNGAPGMASPYPVWVGGVVGTRPERDEDGVDG